MNQMEDPSKPAPESESSYSAEEFGHPRGTLAIVLIYGLIFAASWLGLYLFQFLDRGAPQP